MKTTEISDICDQVKRGAKLSIGRNHAGKLRLKLQRGPFGVLTARYDISEAQLQVLKAKLGLGSAAKPAPSRKEPQFKR
ncbi:MAG: hypothetical protein KGO53_06425 [Alphaproteobacteria bacterium]|nr:hypothetical protein [Alphaproteobacteria bacterium]